jgi:hypothetical protein
MRASRFTASMLGIVLVSGCCEDGLTKAHEIAIDPHGALRAIAVTNGDYRYVYYLVDEAGHVSILGEVRQRRGYELEVIDDVQVSSNPLVDVTVAHSNFQGRSLWVVDDVGGVFESTDDGQTWVSHPLDAGLEPRGISSSHSGGWYGDFVIVYGEGFVRVRSLEGGEWQEPATDQGGWGSLRANTAGPYDTLLSDGASLLVAYDPAGLWQRIDAPTEVLALGSRPSGDEWGFGYIVGGRQGILMEATVGDTDAWTDVTWTRIYEGIDGNVVAIENRWVLTDAGEIVDLDSAEVFEVGDARVGLAGGGSDVVVFGANGPVLSTSWLDCGGYH